MTGFGPKKVIILKRYRYKIYSVISVISKKYINHIHEKNSIPMGYPIKTHITYKRAGLSVKTDDTDDKKITGQNHWRKRAKSVNKD